MSLITVVRDVCAVVGVAAPTSVFASINTNRTMFEMVACANEMAQRISYDTRDWTALRKVHSITGDGVQEAFDLPADYKRMLLTTNVWRSTSTQRSMRFISDTDEWIQRRVASNVDSLGEWTMYGGQLHISPAPAIEYPAWANGTRYQVGTIVFETVDQSLWQSQNIAFTSSPVGTFAQERAIYPDRWRTATPSDVYFIYLDKNCIALAAGGVSDRFQADDDSFRLDERLLKLGMTYDWKMKKGSPYAEDMGTYSDAIANAMGRDKPSPIYIGGRGVPDVWGGYAQY